MPKRFDNIDREPYADSTDPSVESMEMPSAQPPRPKLIDIRFSVDLVVTRFYVVLMVGKDRRDQRRSHAVKGLTKFGNTITAILLLLGANLTISTFIVLTFYLIKSMLGINLMPGHLTEYLKTLLQP
jgi:hypothetical protein